MGERRDVLPQDILDEAHRKRIQTPSESSRQRSLKTPVTGTWYGLGWRTYNCAGHDLVTHSGGVEGYLAQIAWLPDKRAGIVVLSTRAAPALAKIVPPGSTTNSACRKPTGSAWTKSQQPPPQSQPRAASRRDYPLHHVKIC